MSISVKTQTTGDRTLPNMNDQSPPTTHIFGIRHHGPGSARSLRLALEQLKPDIVLVEGPPDAAGVLPLLIHPDMQPPVAILIYNPEQPQHATFYPFAIFSPEWQAMHYALTNNIPVRFMDLAQSHLMAMEKDPLPDDLDPDASTEASSPRNDPLRWLAEASGYSDSERWWEHMVEHRQNNTDLFPAILEAMTTLRKEFPSNDPVEARREATMRQTIRTAQREGYAHIAVVCGAWHAPALATMPPVKDDADLLKDLPKIKVQATWVPWTYSRLCLASGYGAGIESPGWYHHLWVSQDQIVVRWMSLVALLLRTEDLDASSAHVIEAVRLAETLATLRERPIPGLPEMNEAVQTVFCFGSDVPLNLIHKQLIVGEALGKVPEKTPMVPLQQDLQREQKRLRMSPKASRETLDLDLRKPADLQRSHLLHRLNILGISWGQMQQAPSSTGTFHEVWVLMWQPEFQVDLIEKSIWGTTIEEAATKFTSHIADEASLSTLTNLVHQTLLADLSDAVIYLMERIDEQAALTSDIALLMETLPPLVQVLRYGSVRKTDVSTVGKVVDSLLIRICVGLSLACSSMNDDAAQAMMERLIAVHQSVALLQHEAYSKMWHDVLTTLANQQRVHALLVGRCCRLLLDVGRFHREEGVRRMNLAFSIAHEPSQAAWWLEGFLKGSGSLLLHDDALWKVLGDWVTTLSSDSFVLVLPLLRRTFATFTAHERHKMGERVRSTASGTSTNIHKLKDRRDIDVMRAEKVLPVLAELLGL